MTREHYELRKRRLEEQLQAGIQLLESAYQAQVRALDLVWMLQAEETGIAPVREEAAVSSPETPAPPPPAPARPRRRTPTEVGQDVQAALPQLSETFTRGDVCEALGYEPDRAVLYRILQELVREGRLRLAAPGAGQRATIYGKTGVSDSSA